MKSVDLVVDGCCIDERDRCVASESERDGDYLVYSIPMSLP